MCLEWYSECMETHVFSIRDQDRWQKTRHVSPFSLNQLELCKRTYCTDKVAVSTVFLVS